MGTLCGGCAQGMGLRFFETDCFPNDACSDLGWFMAIVALLAVIFVLFLLWIVERPNDATLETPLFFYQVVSLVKTAPWLQTLPASLALVFQSIAKQSPAESELSSIWDGICLFPSMNLETKMATDLLLRFIFSSGEIKNV